MRAIVLAGREATDNCHECCIRARRPADACACGSRAPRNHRWTVDSVGVIWGKMGGNTGLCTCESMIGPSPQAGQVMQNDYLAIDRDEASGGEGLQGPVHRGTRSSDHGGQI